MSLPVFFIQADTCGEAWFKTLKKVYFEGKEMPQHYGSKEVERWSREATVLVNVTNPLKMPRYHFADDVAYHEIDMKDRTENYVAELLEGTLDDKVDNENYGLSYTYHRRFWKWGQQTEKHDKILRQKKVPLMDVYIQQGGRLNTTHVDQFENLINKTVMEPISRKLQMTTWQPHKDMHVSGAPCLQRVFIRLLQKENDPTEYDGLVFQAHFRSRDLFQAWQSNVYGLVEMGKLIADTLSKKMSMKIELKQYTDFSNSLHVYQKNYDQVRQRIEMVQKRIDEANKKIVNGTAGHDNIQDTRCIVCRRGKIDHMYCEWCGFNYVSVTIGGDN